MKKSKSFIKTLSLSALSISCASVVALKAEANAKKQSADEDFAIEEVLVTTQKRGSQALSKTPISIGYIGGDELDLNSSRDLSEVLNTIGGVNLFTGVPGQTTISIRGVATGRFLAGSSTTGYYLDETPFGFTRSGILPDTTVYDLQQVEVLRGPQGTLYGTNSLGGVVRILSKDANLEDFELKTRTSVSNTEDGGDNYSGDVAVNIPLIKGRLAARVVASVADYSGWIDTTSSSNIIDGIAADDINSGGTGNYRIKINALPTDELSIEAGAWISRIDTKAANIADNEGLSRFSSNQFENQNFDIYSLEVNYNFDNFTLLSASNYMKATQARTTDSFAGGRPTKTTPNDYSSTAGSQEIRLASIGTGVWQWSAGLSYRETEERLTQAIRARFPGSIDIVDDSSSAAVFGEVVRSFWDNKIELAAGLRYFQTTIKLKELEDLFLRPELISAEDDFEDISPRLVLTYYPNDELTLYTSLSKGFRTGHLQLPSNLAVVPDLQALVDPDTLWNLEVGVKGRSFDNLLSYETAVYYIDWDDVQQPFLTSIGTAAVLNTGTVKGFGVDLSANLHLSEGLTLGASFGWNGLEIDSPVVSSATGVTLFRSGDRISQSPEYTGSLSADYTFPLGGSGLTGRVGGSASYSSQKELRALNRRLGLRTGKSGEILNAKVSFSVEADQWSAMLYVENLTNENDKTGATFDSNVYGTRLRPRTAGLQLNYTY